MTQTALYRHFDESGGLLYVGISISAVARLGSHIHGSGWASDIRRVDVEMFVNRDLAVAAEVSAIRCENPLHNCTYRHRPPEPSAPKPQPVDFDIRALRRQVGWSQHEMADYLGVDRSTVSRIETGQAPSGPVRRMLELLASRQMPTQSGDAA